MIPGIVAGQYRPASSSAPPPAVGEYWTGEGGYYAGTIAYGNGRQFHLVLAPKSAEATGLTWKTTQTLSYASSLDDGRANADAMAANGGLAVHYAQQHCANYSGDGKTDWHLPAENELIAVLLKLGPNATGRPAIFATGGAQAFASDYHWCSNETGAQSARTILPANRFKNSLTKTATTPYTRPIRRVAV